MALPSFLQRKDPKPSAAPVGDALGDDTGPVQVARTRARRRLIGAVVLLAIGVVGFPMLFETQPRPLPGDIPIDVPRREGAAPRPSPLPRNTPAVTEVPPTEPVVVAAAPAEASAPPPPSPPPAAEAKAAVVKPEAAKPEPPKAEVHKPEPAKVEAPKPEPPKPAGAPKADGDKARALLEGRSDKPVPASAASDPKGGRFVVQVGAYTDANTLREVRAKVEKLGLRTYTQSVDTDAGKRTRVRVGPFPTKSEAESASARLKGAGLPGNVLTL
jgi:DedD protein